VVDLSQRVPIAGKQRKRGDQSQGVAAGTATAAPPLHLPGQCSPVVLTPQQRLQPCLVLTVLRPWVSQVLREHKTRSSNLHVVKLPHELVTHPLGVLSLVSTCQSVSIMSIGKTQHEM
jgi:hypothetical protein